MQTLMKITSFQRTQLIARGRNVFGKSNSKYEYCLAAVTIPTNAGLGAFKPNEKRMKSKCLFVCSTKDIFNVFPQFATSFLFCDGIFRMDE